MKRIFVTENLRWVDLMDIGICVPSHVGDIGYIVRAEELGYSHAWCADSQMIWSDCYATLALAAEKTSCINLGTGVAIRARGLPLSMPRVSLQ